MRCPVCSGDPGQRAKICANCGSLLSAQHLKVRPVRPKVKRGVIFRLVGVCIAAVVGAIAGYSVFSISAGMRPDRGYAGLAGAILGATLVYVISGIKIIVLNRNYRANLKIASGKLDKVLQSAEERYSQAQKLGESTPLTKARMATLHLVKNETLRSVEEFRQAEESGARDPAFFNNYGIALAKVGNRHGAVEVLKQAVVKTPLPEPHVNLAHAIAPPELSKDGSTAHVALEHVQRALELGGESFETLEREGIVLLQVGRFEEAKLEFGRALGFVTGQRRYEADAKNLLGIDHVLAGELREAADEFRHAMSLDPGHARALCNLGLLWLIQKRHYFGMDSLIQARELEPNSGVILNNVAYSLALSKAYNEAISGFRKAVALDANLWESFYNLGKIYTDEGLYENSEKYLERAIEIRPNTWESLVAMGVTKIREGEHMAAAEVLRKAREIAPEEACVLTNLGVALAFVFEYDEAEALLKASITPDGDDALPWARLAWMHVMQGIPRIAAEELKVALSIAPKDPDYNNYYGLVNIDMGSVDVALLYFKRALTLRPDYGAVHYHIGFVHLIRKRISEAIKEWEQTAVAEPEFADGFVNLGVAYYEVDRMDESIGAFRKALVIRQNRMEDYSNLALAYSKQGVLIRKACKNPQDKRMKVAIEKFKLAIDMFDKALNLEPQNVVLHSNRGLACWFAQMVDEACEEWTTVAHLDPEYAARRGELMRSAFDETSLSYAGLRISDRMFGFPLETGPFRYRLAPGYTDDKWKLIIEDDDLTEAPQLAEEVHYWERNIRGLHV